jgi:glycosyltransferase involved in cell wall biosynthesis
MAVQVARICQRLEMPFVLAIGDPQGHRMAEGGFVPNQADIQQQMIDQCRVLVIPRSTLDFYYSKCFRIDSEKIVYFSDCNEAAEVRMDSAGALRFLMHWGQIDSWRPVSSFAEALSSINKRRLAAGHAGLLFHVAGPITDKAVRQHVIKVLGDNIKESGLMPYPEARRLALSADAFLVIVSPRHMDNVPSKLIELISLRRPILLLAHPSSASARLVGDLGIGAVAHPEDAGAIEEALSRLAGLTREFSDAFDRADQFNFLRCNHVAAQLRSALAARLS